MAVGGTVGGVIVGLLIGVAVGRYRKHQSKDKQKDDTAAMENSETWGIQSGLYLRSATYVSLTVACFHALKVPKAMSQGPMYKWRGI